MTTSLSDTLAELIGNVPGVTTLYSPEPAIARAAKIAVATVLRSPATTERIQVSDSAEGVTVIVHLGVARDQSAADVSRSVYDEIVAALRANDQRVRRVVVRIARIS